MKFIFVYAASVMIVSRNTGPDTQPATGAGENNRLLPFNREKPRAAPLLVAGCIKKEERTDTCIRNANAFIIRGVQGGPVRSIVGSDTRGWIQRHSRSSTGGVFTDPRVQTFDKRSRGAALPEGSLLRGRCPSTIQKGSRQKSQRSNVKSSSARNGSLALMRVFTR